MNAKQRRRQKRANKSLGWLLQKNAGEDGTVSGDCLNRCIRRMTSRGYRLYLTEGEQGHLAISGLASTIPAETVTTPDELQQA